MMLSIHLHCPCSIARLSMSHSTKCIYLATSTPDKMSWSYTKYFDIPPQLILPYSVSYMLLQTSGRNGFTDMLEGNGESRRPVSTSRNHITLVRNHTTLNTNVPTLITAKTTLPTHSRTALEKTQVPETLIFSTFNLS